MPETSRSASPEIELKSPADGVLCLRLTGNWNMSLARPPLDPVLAELGTHARLREIAFESAQLAAWDSSLLVWLRTLLTAAATRTLHVNLDGLPPGVRRLLALAHAVPERAGTRRTRVHASFLTRVGDTTFAAARGTHDMIEFIGEAAVALARLARGKARFRRVDLWMALRDCGASALPIVSLISVLVGLILAFVGAVQLELFGAQLYVASLVGIAMVRVMAAVMTGIILAGRTGAAFAAQIGTMQVNEEVDALHTMGFSPTEFLVLPRMLALMIMMPLLCLYADLMGVLGGLIVGVFMLDLGVAQYLIQTQSSVHLTDLVIGLVHGTVFGVLVALAGCLRGMQCGRSASAVGEAVTSAVVTSIVSIIVATAVITVACNVLGI